MKQLCLMADLKNRRDLIEAYERHHRPGNVWPEVIRSIWSAGIKGMRIYRSGARLVMVMDVDDSFDLGAKTANDGGNPVVVEWERQMETYKEADPNADTAGRWRLGACIFDLSDHAD